MWQLNPEPPTQPPLRPPFGPAQHLPEGLLEDLLPGPYTLLLTRLPDAPLAAELNPGVAAIGIRVPDARFIRAVARQHRSALALTSANVSGGQSSVAVQEFRVSCLWEGMDGDSASWHLSCTPFKAWSELAKAKSRSLSARTSPLPGWQDLWSACSLVFDGGQLAAGRAGSTVIDLTRPGRFIIQRRGSGFAHVMQLLQEKYELRHLLGSHPVE